MFVSKSHEFHNFTYFLDISVGGILFFRYYRKMFSERNRYVTTIYTDQLIYKNMYPECKLFINKYPAGIVCIILV